MVIEMTHVIYKLLLSNILLPELRMVQYNSKIRI